MRLFSWWPRSLKQQKAAAEASGERLDRKVNEAAATAHRMAVQTERENSRARQVLAMAEDALRLLERAEKHQ